MIRRNYEASGIMIEDRRGASQWHNTKHHLSDPHYLPSLYYLQPPFCYCTGHILSTDLFDIGWPCTRRVLVKSRLFLIIPQILQKRLCIADSQMVSFFCKFCFGSAQHQLKYSSVEWKNITVMNQRQTWPTNFIHQCEPEISDKL